MAFPFMTLRSLKQILLLSTLAAPVLLPAQLNSSSEEERLEKLMADSAQWYVPRNRVSVGFRVLNSGGKVSFGNLGNVDFELKVDPASAGAVTRTYNNGSVQADAPRTNETDGNGNQTSTPGGHYAVSGTITVNKKNPDGTDVIGDDGNVVTEDIVTQVGSFLSYTPGLTRNWGFAAASQITPDGQHIAMSTYSASTEGASRTKEAGASAGVEFQFVRTLSNPSARFQWGIATGVALNGINSKVSGSVTSTLNTRTDYYSLNGQPAPTAPYISTDAFGDFITSANTTITNGTENTVPLAALPDASMPNTDAGHTETSTPGGVNVDGRWQIKGAYFMVRVGPSLRAQLTSRLGLNASLGVAGAYAGTTYSVAERFQVPDVPDVFVGETAGVATGIAESRATKFMGGYYADLSLEWAASERTGLYTGVTAQKFDGYDQEVGGRTARIDIGSAVGLRGGVSIRF
jgi:hypothetical protein